MKHQRTLLLAGITALLVVTAGVQSAWGAPAWLPEGTEIAGYEMIWSEDTEFTDFTDPEANTTLYTQVWMNNGTNTTSLLAAAMMDNGGSLFSKARPALTGFIGEAIKPSLLAILGLTESEYNALGTIWDVIAVMVDQFFTGSGIEVSEPAIANMNNALLVNDPGESWGFRYFLFGTAGDRVLMVFSIEVDTQWLAWLDNLSANVDEIKTLFMTLYISMLSMFMVSFVAIASMLEQLDTGLFATAQPQASVAPSISLAEVDTVEEMKTFASGWGEIANPPPIFGFEVAVIVAASATTVGLLAIKARKRRA